jgi:hypothetical protein
LSEPFRIYRIRLLEDRVLRRISEPKGEEITGRCRELHIEELHNFWSLPNNIRMKKIEDDISRACSTHRTDETFIQRLGGKLEGMKVFKEPGKMGE